MEFVCELFPFLEGMCEMVLLCWYYNQPCTMRSLKYNGLIQGFAWFKVVAHAPLPRLRRRFCQCSFKSNAGISSWCLWHQGQSWTYKQFLFLFNRIPNTLPILKFIFISHNFVFFCGVLFGHVRNLCVLDSRWLTSFRHGQPPNPGAAHKRGTPIHPIPSPTERCASIYN